MKTSVHLWEHLAEFYYEWDIIQTKIVEKVKKDQLKFLPRKSCRLWDNV
jgi:hypothetical protein